MIRIVIAGVITCVVTALPGRGESAAEAKAKADAREQERIVTQAAEVERKRVAALSPKQRLAEENTAACIAAKAQFKVCETKSGDAYVSCLANIRNVPEDCRPVTNLDDMRKHATGVAR